MDAIWSIPTLRAETAHAFHSGFELAAFALGGWLWRRSRKGAPLLSGAGPDYPALIGCILGAMLGSRLVNWIQEPAPLWLEGAFHLPGQSMVGGLLGGWIGVELGKRGAGYRRSTGDAYVQPMLWALVVGRIGCLLNGLNESTHGLPTNLPWGVDLGDGIARHPTPLYEMLFASVLALVLLRRPRQAPEGLKFRIMAGGYLTWRFLVEFLKPSPWKAAGLSGIQWVCLAGLVWAVLEIANTSRRRDGATEPAL
ncbi:MAG TPA: prolipoprotein diacylglyceryl transferase [Fibrobacteria bacterium]|nr:prolipoprotein diacylglyceryl transferase [Fibrobacteria bacterium]HOX50849.1 prolipoprotein diacylglyceryl transferase [Fibrobacteria bacterium]